MLSLISTDRDVVVVVYRKSVVTTKRITGARKRGRETVLVLYTWKIRNAKTKALSGLNTR